MPATFSAALFTQMAWPSTRVMTAGRSRHDRIELARGREATFLPQHLVPAAADDPARVRDSLRHVLADARQRVVDARRVAQVCLQLQLAETEHVAVRIDEAGQHVLAAAVDDRAPAFACAYRRVTAAALDACRRR